MRRFTRRVAAGRAGAVDGWTRMAHLEAGQQVQIAGWVGAESLDGVVPTQRRWAALPLERRLAVVRRLRRKIAAGARELAEMIPTELEGALHRTVADSLVAEVLPLLEACRFLEREAPGILRTRKRDGRPLWLGSVETEVERVPWGVVLVLGAANYPLLLAGVQTLQALVAGNAVLWKPALGTEVVAFALRTLLVECGLPAELLTVLEAHVESATGAIAAGMDHVVLTGSVETGKAVLRQCAGTLMPVTMELSGCDAVFVLPRADLERAIAALSFGMRFNGSATCMAPRRVFLVGLQEPEASQFESRLRVELESLMPVPLPLKTFDLLRGLVGDARSQGADVVLNGAKDDATGARATLIVRATPSLKAMQTEIFAPILSVMRAANLDEALAASAACPYALTASIFGPEKEARAIASKLEVGNVTINDIIVPTADPQAPFGGRGCSGFGVTRGAEGLLGMTTPRTIQTQRSRSKRAYAATGEEHVDFFAGVLQMLHGGWSKRLIGLKRVVQAARKLK